MYACKHSEPKGLEERTKLESLEAGCIGRCEGPLVGGVQHECIVSPCVVTSRQASLSGTDRTPFEKKHDRVLVHGAFNHVCVHVFKQIAVIQTICLGTCTLFVICSDQVQTNTCLSDLQASGSRASRSRATRWRRRRGAEISPAQRG